MLLSHSSKMYASLKERLRQPLPGIEAHKQMAPPERFPNARPVKPKPDARIGCVLLLLYPDQHNQLHFPLMLRPETGGVHSGQVSLPGGKKDAIDNDNIDTALRETWEEIGVKVQRDEVLGYLSPLYIPPSNFMVYPIVAAIEEKPNLIPNSIEVAELFEVHVEELNKKEIIKQKDVLYKNKPVQLPFYEIQGKMVWGATAMILSEFAKIWEDTKF